MDDLRDHWAFGNHRDEQVQMLRALRRWRKVDPESRQVLVVGGDVHIGCRTDIRHKGDSICQQLISSPIGRKPLNWIAFQALKGFLEAEESLGNRYTFEHSDYSRKRNYGLAWARGLNSSSPHLFSSINEL